jgi:hypothetical protein
MPKLLNEVRNVMRTRHYSLRTEKTYINWIKQFIIFHKNGTQQSSEELK